MSRYCEKSTALMYRYLDEEVTFVRRIRIKVHLRRCPPCEDGYHFEAKLKDRVKTGCYEQPPAELYDRLRAFLHQHGATDDIG